MFSAQDHFLHSPLSVREHFNSSNDYDDDNDHYYYYDNGCYDYDDDMKWEWTRGSWPELLLARIATYLIATYLDCHFLGIGCL